MTAKEYLSQATWLDQKINRDIEEAERLRDMAKGGQSPVLGEGHNPNCKTEAPFVSWLEKAWEREEMINTEIDRLVDLRSEITAVIETVPSPQEQQVLYLRYVRGLRWPQIMQEMHVGKTTVFRWHNSGLKHVALSKKFPGN